MTRPASNKSVLWVGCVLCVFRQQPERQVCQVSRLHLRLTLKLSEPQPQPTAKSHQVVQPSREQLSRGRLSQAAVEVTGCRFGPSRSGHHTCILYWFAVSGGWFADIKWSAIKLGISLFAVVMKILWAQFLLTFE